MSLDIIQPIKERFSNKLEDEIFMGLNLGVVRMKSGDSWGLHSDNHDSLYLREKSAKLKDGEDFTLEFNNIWGIVMYFNDFEGGDIFYPEQGISYHPKKGDLLIHSSEDHCLHGVSKLISEVRYSHSNNLFNYIKVPKEI
jgi:hypothetical protein